MARMSETVQRVLIVEDEVEIRRFVRMALTTEGFDVIEAESVKRGLIEAGTRRPDLVVLDLGLPDGDGVELIHANGAPMWGSVSGDSAVSCSP